MDIMTNIKQQFDNNIAALMYRFEQNINNSMPYKIKELNVYLDIIVSHNLKPSDDILSDSESDNEMRSDSEPSQKPPPPSPP
jgi:hypothetical protein